MDPRNERLVHKQIVRTVCESEDRDVVVGSTSSNAGHYKPHSQYFLITPKLLPDLIYHPKMRYV